MENEFKKQHQEGQGCLIWFLRMMLIALLVTLYFILKQMGVL